MRYLSLLLLLILMKWTWGVANDTPFIALRVHQEVQDDLKSFIRHYIKDALPSVKKVDFQNMWTEEVNRKQMKVHFQYSFEEPDSKTVATLEGVAVLNRDSKEEEKWSFDELYILGDHIEFKEGIVIKASRQ